MKPRLVVVDMVGTSVHSGDEVPAAFREAMAGVGLSLSDADLSRVRGRSKRDAVAELLRNAGVGDEGEVDRIHEEFVRSLRTRLVASVSPVAGAEQALRSLASRMAVVLGTGLDRETSELMLARLGWTRLGLTALVSGDDVARGRPAPDLVLEAMKRADVPDPSEVAVVGDTISDLESAAAARAGWSFGVLSGAHTEAELAARPHTALLASLSELPGWLEARGLL